MARTELARAATKATEFHGVATLSLVKLERWMSCLLSIVGLLADILYLLSAYGFELGFASVTSHMLCMLPTCIVCCYLAAEAPKPLCSTQMVNFWLPSQTFGFGLLCYQW